jgi:uncharacterized surface protein with fasciclin (FAS1) repeats
MVKTQFQAALIAVLSIALGAGHTEISQAISGSNNTLDEPPRTNLSPSERRTLCAEDWKGCLRNVGLEKLYRQGGYTVFVPNFDRIPVSTVEKLFALENNLDLQRIILLHVIPDRQLAIKDFQSGELDTLLPKNKITILVINKDELVTEKINDVSSETTLIGMRINTSTTRTVTRKEIKRRVFINNYELFTRTRTGSTGNRTEYGYQNVIMPPDLVIKYGKIP